MAFEPLLPFHPVDVLEAARVDRRDRRVVRAPFQASDREGDRGHARDAGHAAQRRRDERGNTLFVVAGLRVLDDQVAGERAADGLVDRRLGAVGEHGHEGDERQPDGQSRRGDHRASGLADRVLACELPGDPAPRHERADRPRQCRHDAVVPGRALAAAPQPHRQTRAARHDDHDQHHAEPAPECLAEQHRDEHGEHESDHQAPARRQRTRGDLDTLAHRRQRRHAGRAQRGRQPGEQRDDHADEQRDDDRARLDHRAVVRQVRAEGLEQGVQRGGQRDPAEQPEHRADRTRAAGLHRRPTA